MDLTDTIVPRSDQLNSDDLFATPRTVTITDVRQGSAEQPVDIHLAEYPGRPFRPSKTVRRILVAAWGKDGDAYVGRRLTLYRDPDIKFGGQDVGGIRVSHMSHIDKPMKLALTVSKGKKAPHVVQPLVDAPPPARLPANPDGVTRSQLDDLNAALTNDMGLGDKNAKLAYLSEQLGRPVASSSELSKAEGSRLLERIKAWAEPPTDEPGGEDQQTLDGAP